MDYASMDWCKKAGGRRLNSGKWWPRGSMKTAQVLQAASKTAANETHLVCLLAATAASAGVADSLLLAHPAGGLHCRSLHWVTHQALVHLAPAGHGTRVGNKKCDA